MKTYQEMTHMSKNENTTKLDLLPTAKKISSDVLAKGAKAVTGAVTKTGALGKKLVGSVQGTVHDMSEKAKNDRYLKELKKYNPLFPGEFASETFDVPNIIMICDDAERRGIEVCEGAIGWREKNKDNVEILYLYDNFVENSGLHFIPAPQCDAVYYVDNFDHTRFIRADEVFKKAHNDKVAELRNVAFCLGAKRCDVRIIESDIQKESIKQDSSYSETADAYLVEASAGITTSHQASSYSKTDRAGLTSSEWSGNQAVTRPELKWFRYEETVLKLIENRLSGENHIKRERLELSGSSTATMSRKAAVAVDALVSKSGVSAGSKTSNSLEAQATKESSRTLIFDIEF